MVDNKRQSMGCRTFWVSVALYERKGSFVSADGVSGLVPLLHNRCYPSKDFIRLRGFHIVGNGRVCGGDRFRKAAQPGWRRWEDVCSDPSVYLMTYDPICHLIH